MIEDDECLVKLIDALSDFIRINESARAKFVAYAAITPEDLEAGDAFMDRCRNLLSELEDFEMDPSLSGLLPDR